MALADILTPDWLKRRFLVGIDLTDDNRDPYPDELFEHAIAGAVGVLEAELDLVLNDVVQVHDERKDLQDSDFEGFYLLHLNQRPVREITKLAVRFGNFPETELPLSWAQVATPLAGQIQIMPGPDGIASWSFSGSALLFGGGALTNRSYTPGWWRVSYKAGYDGEEHPVPAEILDAIGLVAALLPLDTAGDLIVGAGIASKSVSIDGLGSTINTTSSATNSGYGARSGQYQDRLKMTLKAIRRRYRPLNMAVM